MESFCSARFGDWSVHGVPAFQDNYLWVIVNQKTSTAVLVDPGCAQSIKTFIDERKLQITHVLVTHHHPDHIGGLSELTSPKDNKFPQPEVIATHTGRIEQATILVKDGDLIHIDELKLRVFELPGHTVDHLGFYVDLPDQSGWLFCGDTLFSGGCGRLFEGSFEQMHSSLMRLRHLPDDTLVFCAHEYTSANLKFLSFFKPENLTISQEKDRVNEVRAKDLPTIPTTIGREKTFNLFLTADSVEDFKKIRLAKDQF